MLKKLKPFVSLLLATGFFAVAFLGCVDEPTMEPYKMPYSAVKFANFTTNVDNIDIRMDTKYDHVGPLQPLNQFSDLNGSAVKNNLTFKEVTNYFDIRSGQRHLQLYDNSGNMIYEQFDLEAEGYGELLFILAGSYSDNEDLKNINVITIANGWTYLDDFHQMPDQPGDTSKVYMSPTQLSLKVVNALYDDLISTPEGVEALSVDDVYCTNTGTGKETRITGNDHPKGRIEPIEKGKYGMIFEPFEAGNYDVRIENTDVDGNITIIAQGNYDLTAETITYLVLHGTPGNPVLDKFEEAIMTTARAK